MLYATKIINRRSRMGIDGKLIDFTVNKAVPVIFHESTEMWSCPLLGKQAYCWQDLRRHIIRQLCEWKRAEIRRKYVAEMDAKAEAERKANMVHVDVAPKDAVEAFR